MASDTFSREEQEYYSALESQSQLKFSRFVKAGTVVRQLRHYFVKAFCFLTDFSAPCHPARAVGHALLGAHACWVADRCLQSGVVTNSRLQVKNYANTLMLLLRLRQACNHPLLCMDKESQKLAMQGRDAAIIASYAEEDPGDDPDADADDDVELLDFSEARAKAKAKAAEPVRVAGIFGPISPFLSAYTTTCGQFFGFYFIFILRPSGACPAGHGLARMLFWCMCLSVGAI